MFNFLYSCELKYYATFNQDEELTKQNYYKIRKFYPKTPIPLNHNNVYTLLIAVLLSAQCTDERVNKNNAKLFSVAPDPKEMSKLLLIIFIKLLNLVVWASKI